MTHYIHHVPGRLRLKTPFFRRNEAEAKRVTQWLAGMDGIASADVNTVTGSLVVKYEAAVVSGHELIDIFRARGYFNARPSAPAVAGHFTNGKTVVDKISDTLVNKVVETVVERSALALIAAVL